jgi:hypothetical protein
MAVLGLVSHSPISGGSSFRSGVLTEFAGDLAVILGFVVVAQEKNMLPGVVNRIMVWIGIILGMVGSFMVFQIWCPNCTG